jgi:hypothetical protein
MIDACVVTCAVVVIHLYRDRFWAYVCERSVFDVYATHACLV